MKKSLAYLFLFFTLCSACHKNNDPSPGSGTSPDLAPAQTSGIGLVSGTLNPPAVINAITATSTVNGQASVHTTFPDRDGKFTFNDLPAGTCKISFNIADARYAKPADITVTVKQDQITDVGTVQVSFDPNNGSISGVVRPAGAAIYISATGYNPMANGFTYQDPVSGAFKITNLPAGTYTLDFIAANGFFSPSDQTVTVNARQNTDAGTFDFDQYGKIISLSCKVNGTAMTFTGTASYLSNNFVMQGAYSNGPARRDGTKNYRLNIRLNNMTAPGTYVFNSTTTSTFAYTWSVYNYIGTGGNWLSQNAGSTATLVVTAIDPSTNTITGTFTASLVGMTISGTSTQVITDGVFTIAYK